MKFVDISDNPDDVLDYITDYDHLSLHYDRLCGKKIGTCKICGKLFKQSKFKDASFCYKHRGYNKSKAKKVRIGVCVDCGNEFSVMATNTTKCRCNNCQKIKRSNDIKQWKMSHKA